MKWLFGNKERCLKSLSCVTGLLSECLESNYLSCNVDKISVALVNLKMVLDANPQLQYRYKDVLDWETNQFLKRTVPYIDTFAGKLKFASFNELQTIENFIYFPDGKVCQRSLVSSICLLGNEAIGQVFINGNLAFSPYYAIEHSLRSTARRWLREANKFVRYFEEL